MCRRATKVNSCMASPMSYVANNASMLVRKEGTQIAIIPFDAHSCARRPHRCRKQKDSHT